jgi:DNA-binding transcriptional ArsR family regulator
MEIEDDTYSSIFLALKHPIRRRILRMLKEHPYSYTEILNELGIDNGLLNYHLENLRELLAKGEDEKYRLSEFGEAALSVIDRVETPKESVTNTSLAGIKNVQSVLIIILLVTSSILNGYFYFNNQELQWEAKAVQGQLNELQLNNTDLQERYGEAQRQLEYLTLWTDDIEVANPRYMYHQNHASLAKYHVIAEKVNMLLQTEKIPGLRDVFIQHYPDWSNGTTYITLSDLSPAYTETILDYFTGVTRDSIHFIKSPASPVMMNAWRERLQGIRFRELGVNVSTISSYYNGKILLGLEKVTPEALTLLTGALHGTVPTGVITVEETGIITLYTRDPPGVPINISYTPSRFGNLRNYTLIIEADLEAPDELPIVNLEYVPINGTFIREICDSVFGLKHVAINDMPQNGKSAKQGNQEVEFFGLNTIYYNDFSSPGNVSSWSISKVKEVSDEFIAKMKAFWGFDTDVEIRFLGAHPSYNTTEIIPATGESNSWIFEVGVFYELLVGGVPLVGPGADFGVGTNGSSIVSAELNYPCLHMNSTVMLIRSPEEALDLLIRGYSDTRSLGFEELYGDIAPEGTCVIKSVKLVYYVDLLPRTQILRPMYQIKGSLIFRSPLEQIMTTLDFTEYVFAS